MYILKDSKTIYMDGRHPVISLNNYFMVQKIVLQLMKSWLIGYTYIFIKRHSQYFYQTNWKKNIYNMQITLRNCERIGCYTILLSLNLPLNLLLHQIFLLRIFIIGMHSKILIYLNRVYRWYIFNCPPKMTWILKMLSSFSPRSHSEIVASG